MEAKERKQKSMDCENKLKKPAEVFEDAATKAKRKVEKLRRQLEREERRIAKAEAKISKTETQTELYKDSQGAAVGQDQNDENKKRKRSASPGSVKTAEEARKVNLECLNLSASRADNHLQMKVFGSCQQNSRSLDSYLTAICTG